MQHDEFIGRVQHFARLPSRGDAERAARATLQTLGERLTGGEAGNLAAQLPPEIGRYLREVNSGQRFSLDEFMNRVSEREGTDLPDAVYHARAIFQVLREAVSPGLIENVLAQLPDDYDRMIESGTEGQLFT